VSTIVDIEKFVTSWSDGSPDLILLSFFNVSPLLVVLLRQLRAFSATLVVIITDLISENQQIELLSAGADIIFTRPYGARLLLAQIKSLQRRVSSLPFFSLPVIKQHELELDPVMRSVTVAGAPPKRLTHLEYRWLHVLMQNAGHIVPTDRIVERVWGYTGDENRELVRGLVKRLRSKIEPNPQNPQYVITEPGIGYYFYMKE
jgi:DNA-binding response OmpR family regulator